MPIKFINTSVQVQYPNEGQPDETTTVELHYDTTLDQVVDAFERFLKASGYHLDGHLEFINEGDEIITKDSVSLDDTLSNQYAEYESQASASAKKPKKSKGKK